MSVPNFCNIEDIEKLILENKCDTHEYNSRFYTNYISKSIFNDWHKKEIIDKYEFENQNCVSKNDDRYNSYLYKNILIKNAMDIIKDENTIFKAKICNVIN